MAEDFKGILNSALVQQGDPTILETIRIKQEMVRAKERELELQEGLPFLHGWKWYPWAKKFYDSNARINLLCAANQISKSSTQIRKCINWATNPHLWPSLWGHHPNQFWYLYPTGDVVKIEFETKWKQFLPKGKFKTEHEIDGKPNFYQWREEYGEKKKLFAIHFDVAGVHVYFKTYAQDTQHLQTGTVDALFCDEELPMEHYPELNARLTASSGYFHMVFTATLGQEFWRQVMEPISAEEEKLPHAHKQTVSLYDAMFYTDGTASHWSEEKIKDVVASCSSESEMLRRVMGRFVMDPAGRKYRQFDMKRHLKAKRPVPSNWLVYAGVDLGSGGPGKAHKSAITFVAVHPSYQKARVIAGWRGDSQKTTAGDVFEKFMAMKRDLKLHPVAQYYDWAAADFFTIASRNREPFIMADKTQDHGEEILNVLFKNDMLLLDEDPEIRKLASELTALQTKTLKRHALDDFCDSLRYACSKIPWNWSNLGREKRSDAETKKEPELTPTQLEIADRRKAFEENPGFSDLLEQEFAFWNEAYDG